MRGLFGTRPWRSADDPCCVMAVQNFKGGVGKSTLAVHLAQYLAIQGYRVALIDCDSQASATTLFGYVPDLDLTEDDTLYPFLRQDELARSEEHTSELQSLMRISYAVLCLKKQKHKIQTK